MELMAEFVMLTQGCTMCYADPKSLTTTGAYPVGALEQFAPTLMVAVPKIWDVIKKGIQAKVAAGSPVAAFLVKTAFEWRSFAIRHGFDTPLFKALVFKKFAKVTGGNLRYVFNELSPLHVFCCHDQTFIHLSSFLSLFLPPAVLVSQVEALSTPKSKISSEQRLVLTLSRVMV
jgi:long-subunit acyl-CoA synthetase (AMP-forming)